MKKVIATFFTAALAAMLVAGCAKTPAGPAKLDPKVAVEKRQEGADLIQKGDLKKAEEVLEQVKVSIPEDAETHFLVGVTLYNKKDYEGAIKEYQEAIRLNAKHFEAYNGLGNTYRDMKKYEDAERNYRKVIELRPQFSYGYTNLALMLANRDTARAIEVLNAGIMLMPGDLDMRYVLADTYNIAGKKDEAKTVLGEILKEAPGYTAAADALKKLNK